jgi:hypothetical protein
LKAFRRRLKNKIVIGFSPEFVLLHDGSWWKLVKPIPTGKDIRLDVCGRYVTNVLIKKDKLELTLTRKSNREIKIYLDWLDRDGNLIQPQFPVENQPKARFDDDMSDWEDIDASFAIIEALLEAHKKDS